MKDSLIVLKKKFPQKHIIVGADTNSYVDNSDLKQFNIYPNSKDTFTTCKKRTHMQPQFNKADKVNEECKDQIISTLAAFRYNVMTIDGKQIKNSFLLPT